MARKRSNSAPQSEKKKPGIEIKILKPGDEVVNIWSEMQCIRIAVRHKNKHIEIFQLMIDEQGFPRLNMNSTWHITFGEGEIVSSVEGQTITTF